MEEAEVQRIIEKQRNYFNSGATLDLAIRSHALARLKAGVKKYSLFRIVCFLT